MANSFVGSTDGDGGNMTVYPLVNGNYVIGAPNWDDGATSGVGAATWRPGTGPAPGAHSIALSLIGSTAMDGVGSSVVALTNGNYVVGSAAWHYGASTYAGAATWGDGATGVSGVVSSGNSFIGTQAIEQVGSVIIPLADGNYVLGTYLHDDGAKANVGAVTWRPGTTPSPDLITSANSVIGTTAEDRLGSGRFVALPGGDWVMANQAWDNNGIADAGAITRYAGGGPVTTPPSPTNSLVGSGVEDLVGRGLQLQRDGSYVVYSPGVDNGPALQAGAITWVRGALPVGPVSAANSLIGDANDGLYLYVGNGLTANRSLVVGRPETNHVSLITPTEFVSIAPARLADTRQGSPTVDGAGAGGGPVAAGSTLEVAVLGRGGVPAGAPAVALNVTAAEPQGSGFVTVYPCGGPRPLASNLNVTAGAVVPNAVMAKVGQGGTVCVYTSATTHLVVDVDGYFPSGSVFQPSNPARLLDTRPEATFDGLQQGAGKLATDQVLQLQVGGRAGVPADVRSVALNVTVTEPEGPGFITVFPCGGGRPLASNLNFVAGSVVANLVVSDVGAGGTVCLYTSRTTHLVADVNGWFPLPSGYRSMTPARLLDSRAEPTVDGQFTDIGLRGRGTVTAMQVTGRAGVPAETTSVMLNVTATEAAGGGFVTVYPCGIAPPLASNLNYVAGSTVPNAVIVQVGTGGQVCLFNSEATHLVVDIAGFLTA
ncbi:MAG: hypothetical protein HZB15_14465 [Actinobacteria bacterium]|nr:hypothetical protein [Actinomycetota bacterium]